MTDQPKVPDPIALEKKLAAVMGYVDVGASRNGQLVGRFPEEKNRTYLPSWARDNGAAFEVMTRNQLSVGYLGNEEGRGQRRVASDTTRVWATAYTGDFKGDEEATVRAAIVEGAIIKIEASHDTAQFLKNSGSKPPIE